MEPKQRAAASASSQAKVKMSKQVARVVGFDLRTSTEIKMSLAASDPRLLQKNRALGWASVLRVKVSRAQDLAQKNTVTGKSDPYVVVSLGAREFQTAYIPKNLNPIWNEVHECVLSKGDMEGMLVFRVYDYDAILTHQFMGEVQFDMAKTKFPFKGWSKLQSRGRPNEEVTGEILLSISIRQSEKEERFSERRERVLASPFSGPRKLRRNKSESTSSKFDNVNSAKDKFSVLRENKSLRSQINLDVASKLDLLKKPAHTLAESPGPNEGSESELVAVPVSSKVFGNVEGDFREDMTKVRAPGFLVDSPMGTVNSNAEAKTAKIVEKSIAEMSNGKKFVEKPDSSDGGNVGDKIQAAEAPGKSIDETVVRKDEKSVGKNDEKNAVSEDEKSAGKNVVSEDEKSAEKNVVSEDEKSAGKNVVSEDENSTAKNVVSEDENSAEKNVVSEDEKNVVSEDEKNAVSEDEKNVVSEDEKSAEKNVVSEDEKNVVSEDEKSAEKNVVSEDEKSAGKNVVSEDENSAAKNVVSEDENSAEKNVVSEDEKNVVSEDEKNAVSEDEKNVVSEDEKSAEKNVVSEDEKSAGKNVVSEDENSAAKNVVSEDENSAEKNVVSEDEKNVVSEDEKSAEKNVVSEEEKNVVSEDEKSAEKNVVSEDENSAAKNVVSEDEKNVVSEDEKSAGKNVVSEDEKNVVSEDEKSAEKNVVSEDEKSAEKNVVSENEKNVVSEDEKSAEKNVVSDDENSGKNVVSEDVKNFISEDEKSAGKNNISEVEKNFAFGMNSKNVPLTRLVLSGSLSPGSESPVPSTSPQALLRNANRHLEDTATGFVPSASFLMKIPKHDDVAPKQEAVIAPILVPQHAISPSPSTVPKDKEEEDDLLLPVPGRVLSSSSQKGKQLLAMSHLTFSSSTLPRADLKRSLAGDDRVDLKRSLAGDELEKLTRAVFGGGHALHTNYRAMMGSSDKIQPLRASTPGEASDLFKRMGFTVTASASLYLNGDQVTCAEAFLDPLHRAQRPQQKRDLAESHVLDQAQRKIQDLRHQTLNERFQCALARLELVKDTHTSNAAETAFAYQQVMNIAKDFLHVSQTYGKVIITERFLSYDEKTIKPIDIGGRAGGVKFIVSGVLFKFAIDAQDLFHGSDAAAHKVAGHELRGLMSYFSSMPAGVSFPLMCLIDYLGFRLICMSLLPIKGQKTLIYGSRDAGRTVVASDERFNEAMRIAAKTLNVSSCLRGIKAPGTLMHSAIDIEGHLGEDGRFYMLDFARAMPPEAPRDKTLRQTNDHLYRLLRPE